MIRYDYFKMFITPEVINCVIEQTNLYSLQKKTFKEHRVFWNFSLIGIFIKMDVVLLPSYKQHWAWELRYSPVADVMPRNCFQQLLPDYNNNIDKNDKLAKMKPIIEAAHNESEKVEPEEFLSIDEQIIPSKTKFSSICQYNPKKPK